MKIVVTKVSVQVDPDDIETLKAGREVCLSLPLQEVVVKCKDKHLRCAVSMAPWIERGQSRENRKLLMSLKWK